MTRARLHRLSLMLGTAVALVVGSLSAGPAAAKTLAEVVQTAISTNPEVGAISSNRRAIQQELRQARGLYLPSIDGRAAGGYGALNSEATREREGRGTGDSGWVHGPQWEAGLTLQQMLFDGFAADSEVKRQIGRTNSARFRVSDTAQSVGLSAVEAYLEILRNREIVLASEENVRAHEEILGRVDARARGGRGPQSDVDQARARLSAARASLAQVRGRLQDALANYLRFVGEAPEALEPVVAPELELPSNVDEAVAIAIENSPAIQAAQADIVTAEGTLGAANANFYPRVDIEAGANIRNNYNEIEGVTRSATALAVGRYNFYRGGIDTARRREALARIDEARDVLDQGRREVEEQVRLSWSALNAARERRVALREQTEAITRVREAYSQQFDLGQRTLLDLLDIQNELFVTRTGLLTEDYTVRFGVFRTLATMGLLLSSLGVQLPEEAVVPPPTFGEQVFKP